MKLISIASSRKYALQKVYAHLETILEFISTCINILLPYYAFLPFFASLSKLVLDGVYQIPDCDDCISEVQISLYAKGFLHEAFYTIIPYLLFHILFAR